MDTDTDTLVKSLPKPTEYTILNTSTSLVWTNWERCHYFHWVKLNFYSESKNQTDATSCTSFTASFIADDVKKSFKGILKCDDFLNVCVAPGELYQQQKVLQEEQMTTIHFLSNHNQN